ncbi:MAG: hypothetical protein H6R00_2133 [Proteobacteria bacterium]|nr:hypothetical protein [Pseudomonadota bacterium]
MKETPIVHRLIPGQVPLSVWRAIYFGDGVAIDPAARGPVDKAAATIEAILGKGEPVYGVS